MSAGGLLRKVPARRAVTRWPVYVGAPTRGLFGWYHLPPRDLALDRAVIICPPVGPEYFSAHRSLRHLADRLALAGFVTVRFDYLGTGDSAPHRLDRNRVAAWVASLKRMMAAVQQTAGVAHLALVGVRLGALLAARAAVDVPVADLALWAPCLQGRGFVRELKALDLTGRTGGETLVDVEAGGVRLTPSLEASLGTLHLKDLRPRADRVFVAEREDRPDGDRLVGPWTAAGLSVDRQILPGFADMVRAPHNTVVPNLALDAIVGWLVTRARPHVGRQPTAPRSAPPIRIGPTREHPCGLGSRGDLFAIVTEPAEPRAGRPTIVLSNAGSVHHVGPNQLYVELARAFAEAGFRSVRLDLSGLGDSPADRSPENDPYPAEASTLVAEAIRSLMAQDEASSFVLMGLCSGAHTAFHAAVDLPDLPIVEAVLINPLTFAYRPGMSLDAPDARHVDRWQRYRRSLRTLRGWRKLLETDTDRWRIAQDVLARSTLVWRRRTQSTTDLERALGRLARLGRHVTLVCSRFDPGYDLLMLDAGRLARRLRRSGALSIGFIDGANHTFDATASRAALIASLTRGLVNRYGRT